MPLPKIATQTDKDKRRVAETIVSYWKTIQQGCDYILANPFSLKNFQTLVHTCRMCKREMDEVIAAPETGEFAVAIRMYLEEATGRSFNQQDLNAALLSFHTKLGVFIPTAIAWQPVDDVYGGLITVKRNMTTGDLEHIILDPPPSAAVTMVQDLRSEFEA